ncbi:MAG: acyl-ACP--UDP-N-acetylglucosamine O-acyltransferase [Alphaproteobacteria bacterium]|jgi:UDP-N-acetylglucosamine acyltransferase|nr:acyl-ACP--UDP-N-acetylglucosamine O-acyltransferase [Alphaproteobacteria bacterium]
MSNIHNTAIIQAGAIIPDSCKIGPFCIVGSQVKLGENVELMANVYIDGDVEIGEGTVVFPFAVIGVRSQDLKYNGEPTKIIIGKNNQIREHVTIHLATVGGGGITKIGDNCLLMVASHVAHDVNIGNNVILDNNVLLAGHVIVEDSVIIGGGSAVHQFCRIGEGSFIGGMSGVVEDIIPFALYTGVRNTGEINGINLVGLRRRGYSREDIGKINEAYDIIFSKETKFAENVAKLKEFNAESKGIQTLVNFLTSDKSRSICTVYKRNN